MLPCALLRRKQETGCHRNLTEEALGDSVSPIIYYYLLGTPSVCNTLPAEPKRRPYLRITLTLTDVDPD
jgi:hypothetical protein